MTDDTSSLDRFVDAQAPVFQRALDELRAGAKRTHWMWFVFPQLRGLGASAMADRYGLASLDEARAYLDHPVLGPRLRLCVDAVSEIRGRSLHDVFGSPDDRKFGSSMTLFSLAETREPNLFHTAIDRWCDGRPDPRTLALVGARGPAEG